MADATGAPTGRARIWLSAAASAAWGSPVHRLPPGRPATRPNITALALRLARDVTATGRLLTPHTPSVQRRRSPQPARVRRPLAARRPPATCYLRSASTRKRSSTSPGVRVWAPCNGSGGGPGRGTGSGCGSGSGGGNGRGCGRGSGGGVGGSGSGWGGGAGGGTGCGSGGTGGSTGSGRADLGRGGSGRANSPGASWPGTAGSWRRDRLAPGSDSPPRPCVPCGSRSAGQRFHGVRKRCDRPAAAPGPPQCPGEGGVDAGRGNSRRESRDVRPWAAPRRGAIIGCAHRYRFGTREVDAGQNSMMIKGASCQRRNRAPLTGRLMPARPCGS